MKLRIIIISLFLPTLLFAQSKDDGQKTNPTYQEEVERIAREYPEEKRVKGTGWKQQERWKENMYYYTEKSGKLYNTRAKTQKELSKYENTHPEMKSNQPANGSWENMGGDDFVVQGEGYLPGVGRVNSFAADPQNSSVLYVGSAAGGLWKSPDAGSTWEPLTDGMVSSGVSGIAISHQNNNNIYILTGDGDARHTVSSGIKKSLDGGITWQETALTFIEDSLRRGYCLIIDPTDELHQIAGFDNGLYETRDGWETFSIPIATPEFDRIFDIEFKPGDPQTVYAASRRILFKSSDGGENFDAGIIVAPWNPNISSPNASEGHRTEIAVTEAFPENIYLINGGFNNGFIGLYLSEDSGDSWGALSQGGSPIGALNILNVRDDGNWIKRECQAVYDLALAIAPSNPSTILSGGINLWGKDLNVNNNWDIKTHWHQNEQPPGSVYMHGDIHELVYVGNTLYCCNDGGIYKSTNHGTTWTNISAGLIIAQFYEIDSADGISEKVLGGTQDNGTNRIDNTVAPGMAHVLGGDGMWARFQNGNPTNAFCSKQFGDLYFSSDGGVTFNNTSQPPGGGRFVTPFETIGNSLNIWYGGENALYRKNWGAISSWVDGSIDSIRYLSSTTSTTNIVYYCDNDSLKVREYTLDFSTLLIDQYIHGGLPVDQVNLTSVTVDPGFPSTVLATFSGYVAGEKIYVSSNKGGDWTNISGSLPNVPIFCAEFEPGLGGGIYVGTDIGVFYRNSSMSDWVYFSNNLPRVPVRDLDYVESENKLRAATFGRSVWQSSPYTTCPSSQILVNSTSTPNYQAVEYYEASSFILSAVEISGGPGTDVTYQSGNEIILSPGFEVTQYSEFEGRIGPCGTTIPPPIPAPSGMENEIQSNSLNSEQ